MDTRRYVFVTSAMMLVAILLFGFYRCSMGPTLYAGDRMEMQPCYLCSGAGCGMCEGKGKREVLVPGPNHPTRVMGEVFDGAVRSHMDYENMPHRVGPNVVEPGAIEGAAVVIEGNGERIERTTNNAGKFRATLPPGSYTVTVTRSGYSTATVGLAIPVLTTPMLQDEGAMEREMEYIPPPDAAPPPRGTDSRELPIALGL